MRSQKQIEHAREMGKANKGKKFSPDHRENISKGLKRAYREGRRRTGFSLEHREKISKALRGNKHALGHQVSEELKQELRELYQKNKKNLIGNMLGKHHSDETKGKISSALIGAKNHLWRGGISFEPYGLEFTRKLKETVRKRDKYTCQECGCTQEGLGYKLHVHHIDYDKKNSTLNNLISLCRICHCQTNFKREDWTEYFEGQVRNIL